MLGIPEVRRRPAVRAATRDRTANRAELQPILVERLATRGADEWFDLLVDAGVPVRADQHHRRRVRDGRAVRRWSRSSQAGEGERALPMARHPITFSATPARYALPPPELDEHGAELRKWLAS